MGGINSGGCAAVIQLEEGAGTCQGGLRIGGTVQTEDGGDCES